MEREGAFLQLCWSCCRVPLAGKSRRKTDTLSVFLENTCAMMYVVFHLFPLIYTLYFLSLEVSIKGLLKYCVSSRESVIQRSEENGFLF